MANGNPTMVVLTRNNFPFTKICLDSIARTLQKPYHVIIVDSASEDETVRFIRKNKSIVLIENVKNVSPPQALNQAINYFLEEIDDSSFLVKLDNDVLLTAGWFESMLKKGLSSESVGVVGAHLVDETGVSRHTGGIIYGFRGFPSRKWRVEMYRGDAPSRSCPWVSGACFLVKRDILCRIGGFDERYPFWFDDVDYCFKARNAGFKVIYCRDALIYHFEHKRDEPVRPEVFVAHDLFVEKWRNKSSLWTNRANRSSLLWAIFNDLDYFFVLLDMPREKTAAHTFRSHGLGSLKSYIPAS